MNYQNPPVSPSSYGETRYERAVRNDRPQPDPELASAEGKAGVYVILAYFAAMVFVTSFVLYGLNHQRNEATPPPEATSAAPSPAANNAAPPSPTQQPNPQQGNQGGPNPPASQKQAQPQQNPPPTQQQATPATGQQPQPNAQPKQQPTQPQAPAQKQ